ncbi:hypothetical protein [Micromonospora sp. CPCC 205556]|uniref:hypothetical protein n=1 Tax=Micromonospora sp. CPCC 205556 TaxID=3122398 RepID=UPI002FF0B7E0
MRERWRAIGVLAGALFAVNVVARLTTEFGFDGNDTAQSVVSLIMFLVIGAILAGVVFVRGRVEPVAEWGGVVGAAIGVALLLTILVGPLLVGDSPIPDNGGLFFAQFGLYLLATGAGVALGYLVLTALGWDHRSQQLKRYAERTATKPPRVVRR